MADVVFIEGLRIDAVIGVHDWEQLAPQPLLLDIELAFDNRVAAESQALADTFDYAAITLRLEELLHSRSWRLIETVAERCCELLRDEFGVVRIVLRVAKPDAVRQATSVGVRIERDYANGEMKK
jgi:dihydroneopterin aldolase